MILLTGLWGSALATEVGPLLETAWHQREPFNHSTPIGSDGEHSKVGCVALAWAQILFFHQHENDVFTGIGNHSYSTWAGLLNADLSDPYDWDAMPLECGPLTACPDSQPNSCDGAAAAAVGELCYEVGVAFHNSYGTYSCDSTAPGNDDARSMRRYFRFSDAMEYEVFTNHTPDSWFEMVQEEINAGRPLYCNISNSVYSGSHAVVIDGWRESPLEGRQLHFNYGNGPSGNKWLDPVNHPNYWFVVGAYRNIQPENVTTVSLAGEIAEYPTIQSAIDAVDAGTVIKLLHTENTGPSIYSGPGNQDLDFGGKDLVVRSENYSADEVHIYCDDNPNIPNDYVRAFVFHSGESSESVVEGLTIRSGDAATKGGAIAISNGSAATISNCILRHNEAPQGGAIYVGNASAIIRGCTIYENNNDAIATLNASLTIENTIISNNDGMAVDCGGLNQMIIDCTDIYGNSGGDWAGCIARHLGTKGNISLNPLFCDPDDLNFTLMSASPCLPGNNSCQVQMGALGFGGNSCLSPDVEPNGTGIYATIQDALNAAQDGENIMLADGVFSGPGNRDLDFLGKNITLRSASDLREECIIECEGSETEPHRAFIFQNGESAQTVIRGITIQGGWENRGGAIFCKNGSSPTFEKCRFLGNYAAEGGVVASDPDCNPSFSLCVACDNEAIKGGFYFGYRGGIQLNYCTIGNNEGSAFGSAMFAFLADVTVENTIISGNTGDDACFFFGGTVSLSCTDIWGNPGGDWTDTIASQLGMDGNASVDPMFCDAGACDLSLQATSPCRNLSGCGGIGDSWWLPCSAPAKAVRENKSIPVVFGLKSAVPNPFNPTTTISYSLPQSGHLRVALYDIRGQHIKTLVDEWQTGGDHSVTWSGTDNSNRRVSSGVYFIRMESGGVVSTEKVMLAK